jgi:hypothetical protein
MKALTAGTNSANIAPATNTGSLQVMSLQDKLIMADQLAKSGLMPASLRNPEQVFVALQWGEELNLSPMVAINNIAVIKGRPTLSADLQFALVRANPEYAGCTWVRQDDKVAEVIIRRRCHNVTEDYRSKFTIDDAMRAGLIVPKSAWETYPARMLKHRALSFACRDAFPDVIAGVYSPEEMQEINLPPINVTPSAPPTAPSPEVTQYRKQLLQDIAKILKAVDPDNNAYFEEDYKAPRREYLKKYGDINPIEDIEAVKAEVVTELKRRQGIYEQRRQAASAPQPVAEPADELAEEAAAMAAADVVY